jgi:hypothetical protein
MQTPPSGDPNSKAFRTTMTIPAPLIQVPHGASRSRTGLAKLLATAATGLALLGCAGQVIEPEAPAATQITASDVTQSLGIEATAINAGATTPSMRTLGMSSERKRALRRLAVRSIRTDHPGEYTVVKGDTLWDISERFLNRPWLWPEIWHVNPQIKNPHLIYPGDRVSLTYVNGQPQLQLIRASSRGDGPIGTYPADGLESFLIEAKIVSAGDLKTAPYVVSTEDDRLIASIGNHIYARGNLNEGRYSIFRPGKALIDPDTNQLLGHEAIHVSRASMVKSGDPSKLVITSNKRETLVGDRLMPNDGAARFDFQPRIADIGKTGKVISLFDALARVGQNQVVVLNLGTNDGVQEGDVLSVYGNDRIVRDVVSGKKHDYVTIDGEKSGVVMVFRAFDRASYALVVQSEKTINLYDRVGGIQ